MGPTMASIPIAKPLIGPEEQAAVQAVLESGILAQGPRVAEFEQAFADFCGVKHAVASSNGTTSLHLALMAAGVGPGDEVITTPFSFFATGSTIRMAGATPVFVDIDPVTFNISPEAVGAAVNEKTKAVQAVHLYGQPCDMDPLRELCTDKGIVLVEDACQAHGAEYKGSKAGSLGDVAGFSFYPTKNMTCGEGGMTTTNDTEIAEQVQLLRAHGQSSRYQHAALGYNFRMTDVHAAIGLGQLKKINLFTQRRQENAAQLNAGLANVEGLQTPEVGSDRTHVYHQYTIRTARRDELKEHLQKTGIGFGVHYPQLINQSPAMKQYASPCPHAEKATKEVLSLPVHPAVGDEDLEKIVTTISQFFS